MRRRFARLLAFLLSVLPVLAGAPAFAQTIMPTPFQTELDNSGHVVNNGCVWTYVSGSTTPATTWSDSALSTPNTNPIRSDSAGRFTAFLAEGSSYKFVYESSCTPPSTHGTVYRTADNITAQPGSSANVVITGLAGTTLTAGECAYLSDGSGGKVAGSWYACDSGNTYSSTTPIVGLTIGAITSGTTGSIQLAGQATGLSALVVGSPYYVSTAGTLTLTAPSSRRFVGIADSTTTLQLASNPPIALEGGWTVVTTTSTGTQNDFAPGLIGNTILRCNNAALLTIDGFSGGYDGERVVLVSIGAGQVDLAHQNSGSSAAYRLINFATSANTSLAAGSGTAEYVYDSTTARWRLAAHEQGAWITATFNAANFTATGGGSWTVGSGDVTSAGYWLKGRTMFFNWQVATTTVAGTVTSMNFLNAAWGGFTAVKTQYGHFLYNDNGAGNAVGYSSVSAGDNKIVAARLSGSFSAATDNTGLFGGIFFEVQ